MFAFTQTKKCGMIMAVKEYSGHDFHLWVGVAAACGGIYMERWENRYAHGRGGASRSVEHSKADRIKNILLILLAVALLGIGIAGGRAIAFRAGTGEKILQRMMTECGDAVGQVNTLSRYGGSDSAALLGKIRANIHAVDACNQLYASLYGKQLVASDTLNQLYATVDSYMDKLKNGSSSLDEQTSLAEDLAALQALLQTLR